jgi:pyrophosphatase PpaX
MDAVIFDWDGTLIDSLPIFYRANAAVMAQYGLPFDESAYRRHVAANWRQMYTGLGLAVDQLEEANARWHAELDGAREAMLLPGVDAALARLADAGIRAGLVTAGHRSLVIGQLDRLGLAERFEIVVCGDDLDVHKPDPAPLRFALAAMALTERRAETAYVGDTPDDMRMARTVGVHAVGIPSLIGEPRDLLAAGAHEVADSVLAWVTRLLSEGARTQPPIRRVGPGLLERAEPDPAG